MDADQPGNTSPPICFTAFRKAGGVSPPPDRWPENVFFDDPQTGQNMIKWTGEKR
jgi:hypothetical protein